MELREQQAASHFASPGHAGQTKEADLIGELRKHIDALPELESQMLTYSFGAGLSHREIAEVLNVSRQTVTLKISKALEILRGNLAKAGTLAAVPLITDQNLIAAITTGFTCPPGLTEKILSGASIETAVRQSVRIKKAVRATQSPLPAVAALVGLPLAAVVLWFVLKPAPTLVAPPAPPPVVAATTPAAASAPTPVAAQTEVLYEDDFQGTSLASFWAKRPPQNQFLLESKVGLILMAAGKDMKVNGATISPEAELVSELIELKGQPILIRSASATGGFTPMHTSDKVARQMTIEFGGKRAGVVIDFPRPMNTIPMKAVSDVEVLDENGNSVYRSRLDCEKGITTVTVGGKELPPLHTGATARVLIGADGKICVRGKDTQRYLHVGTLPKETRGIRLRRAARTLSDDSVMAQPVAWLQVQRLAKWPDELVDNQ